HRFILVVLDDQLQHHKKKLNALKHLTSGRKKLLYLIISDYALEIKRSGFSVYEHFKNMGYLTDEVR
ncbi:hypothetical protein D0502_10425, partial [Leuconostoc falkenbergense]